MAGNYYICKEYVSYNLQSPWSMNYYNNLTQTFQSATNQYLIALTTGYSIGILETTPFAINIDRDITSIDVLWDQWNCSPTLPNIIFTFYISVDGGQTYETSEPLSRSVSNGNKVRMSGIIDDYLSYSSIMVKFKAEFNKNGGYSPTMTDNITLFFNTRIRNTAHVPGVLRGGYGFLVPSVNAVNNNNASVLATKMSSRGLMLAINPMVSWNGTNAVINIPSLSKANISSYTPDQIIATGALNGTVEPLQMSSKASMPVPFAKDQDTVDVSLELTLNKVIELEVTLYDF